MSFVERLIEATQAGILLSHIKTPGANGYYERPAGAKMRKRAGKHRLDHSNPGGTVSMFFREKRTRLG